MLTRGKRFPSGACVPLFSRRAAPAARTSLMIILRRRFHEKDLMKLLALVAALLLCCLPALAEEADDNPELYSEQGLPDSGPGSHLRPHGLHHENGDYVGFDIDLAQAVCDRLGVALVCQPVDWDAKEMELNAKGIDCIWNGLSISEERKASMSISLPYMRNAMILVVRADSGLAAKADLAGKKLGLQSGSTAEEALDADEGI